MGETATAHPDDMAPPDPGKWPALGGPLAAADRALADRFLQADRAAVRHQRQHRALTVAAAGCGAVAVLFAIVQLGYPVHFRWLPAVEVAAALAALTAVGLGLVAARRTRWLLQRHRAERLRLLRYRFLTDPALWADPGSWPARFAGLEADAARIAAATAADLDAWLGADAIPDPPPAAACARVPADTRTDLVAHYRTVRLAVQADYFRRQAARNARLDRPVRYVPVACFFASVLAAFGHFASDLAGGDESFHGPSVLLIVLAAAVPVAGAAVRTVRLAHEFARNTSRFRAKRVVLERLADALAAEPAPATAFRELWCAEQVLESEHREWLRLMADAEWFG